MMSNLLTFATIDLPDTIKAALIPLIARFIQTKQPSKFDYATSAPSPWQMLSTAR